MAARNRLAKTVPFVQDLLQIARKVSHGRNAHRGNYAFLLFLELFHPKHIQIRLRNILAKLGM
jgi:hypothetical protein